MNSEARVKAKRAKSETKLPSEVPFSFSVCAAPEGAAHNQDDPSISTNTVPQVKLPTQVVLISGQLTLKPTAVHLFSPLPGLCVGDILLCINQRAYTVCRLTQKIVYFCSIEMCSINDNLKAFIVLADCKSFVAKLNLLHYGFSAWIGNSLLSASVYHHTQPFWFSFLLASLLSLSLPPPPFLSVVLEAELRASCILANFSTIEIPNPQS